VSRDYFEDRAYGCSKINFNTYPEEDITNEHKTAKLLINYEKEKISAAKKNGHEVSLHVG
jgi:hypothetical protein